MIDLKRSPLSIPARRGEPCRRTPSYLTEPEFRGTYASAPLLFFKIFLENNFPKNAEGKFVIDIKKEMAKSLCRYMDDKVLHALVVTPNFHEDLTNAGYNPDHFIVAKANPQ
jgi:hypothetical protein